MRTTSLILAGTAVAAAMTIGPALAGGKGKDEPKPIVHVPKTWDAAVEEAKTLVVPIVVHSHGFY